MMTIIHICFFVFIAILVVVVGLFTYLFKKDKNALYLLRIFLICSLMTQLLTFFYKYNVFFHQAWYSNYIVHLSWCGSAFILFQWIQTQLRVPNPRISNRFKIACWCFASFATVSVLIESFKSYTIPIFLTEIYQWCSIAYTIIICSCLIKQVKKHEKELKTGINGQKKSLHWSLSFFYTYCLLASIYLCKKITFLEYWDEFYQILQFLWILGFIRSAFLHLFGGLLGIMRKAIILDVDHETNSSIQIEKNRANSQFNIVTTEANRNCDSQEEISKVWKTIEKLLTQEKLYLNDSLTIADLSKECNETVNLISRAIHQYKGLNFNTYVNYKRVEYAQALLLQEESWSIEYIGKKAGFKSNSAFYRAFHLQSNMTPRKFQQLNAVSSS